MKVIKSGKRKHEEPRQFTCRMCGCVFEAESEEYDTTFADERGELVTIYSANCPECESLVHAYGRDGFMFSSEEYEKAAPEMVKWKDSRMKSNQYTWHKVADDEPKKKGWYIVYLKNGSITSYFYETYDDMGFYPENYGQYIDVIAWTEFPEYDEQ